MTSRSLYTKQVNIGHVCGRLRVTNGPFKIKDGTYWGCTCDCGNTKQVRQDRLYGNTRSCGCLNIDTSREAGRKRRIHGSTGTKEHDTWRRIQARCYNKNHPDYKNYGGRGIYVCTRWLESFNNFLEDMGKAPTNKHSIDRIDNNLGYTKENCRWSDRITQANNKRNNRQIEFNGLTLTLAQWARHLGIHKNTIYNRIKRGLPLSECFKNNG